MTTIDNNKIWAIVGSAGTVDETDVSKVFFDRSIVQMGHPLADPIDVNPEKTIDDAPVAQNPGAIFPQTESAMVRYNVVPVDGLLFVPAQPCTGSCEGIQLELRYLAANNGGVVAKLIEVDMATGDETVRLTFNSNNFGDANHYQVQSVGECGPRWHFDFKSKAYYIEATLTANTTVVGNAAGIQIIRINNVVCP